MDRRKFLGMASASVVLGACGGGGDGKDKGIIDPGGPSQLEWTQLAEKITGSVARPGSANYEAIRRVVNARYNHIKPAAVISCANTHDIQESLAFAKAHQLPLVPRSGGHGYAGYSTTEGIVLDLSPLNAITLDEGTATVGAGAKLIDVYDQLTAQGVAIPAGSCVTVGIGGLTQGGGIGIVDRAYGLTCDNLLSVEVVLADGRILTCDSENEPDLFWALRGGGGGNFGIVSRFTFKTHAADKDITTLKAWFEFDDFVSVMAAWQNWPTNLPNDIWAQAIPDWSNPALPTTLFIRVFCIGSQEYLAPYWEALLDAAQSTPTKIEQSTSSYRNTLLGDCLDVVPLCHMRGYEPDGVFDSQGFAASSDFFSQAISESGLEAMKQAILDSRTSENYGMIIMDLMGGVIDEIAADETAFIHRGALFSAEYYSLLPPNVSNAPIDKAQRWANNFRQTMKPWTTGQAYVNYIDPLIEDWEEAYYGDNYSRLQQVKSTYDPDWTFKIPQGVRPAN